MKGLVLIEDRAFATEDPYYWALRAIDIDPGAHIEAAGEPTQPLYLGQIAMSDEEAWQQIASEGRLMGTKVG